MKTIRMPNKDAFPASGLTTVQYMAEDTGATFAYVGGAYIPVWPHSARPGKYQRGFVGNNAAKQDTVHVRTV